MKQLTLDSMLEASYKCAEVAHYKVGIAFPTGLKEYIHMVEYTRQTEVKSRGLCEFILKETGIEVRVRETKQAIFMDFSNGSRITLFIVRDGCRGYKFNEVFYDYGISEDMRQQILRPMEIKHLKRATDPERYFKFSKEAFDEFLGDALKE